MAPALVFYDVVTAVHVMCVVIAFGAPFAYPILVPWVRRTHPEGLAALHGGQSRISRSLITPAATLVLLTGLYMAADRDLFSEVWVTVPMGIVLVLLGLTGAYFVPTERRLGELAAREGPGEEYAALLGRWNAISGLAGLLVLVAIFFMVAKPGA